ncbi:MAG: PIG-L deacetylase family protein [Christensenellales bacterium]
MFDIRKRICLIIVLSLLTICPAFAARPASLAMTEPGQAISEIDVYAAGDLPESVPDWQPPHETSDLMVIAARPGDEFLYFGGIIPYYARARQMRVTAVYMADAGRAQRAEALEGLWAAGLTAYPEFLGFQDEEAPTIKDGVEAWGGTEAIVEALVSRIRRYRPAVIVTHDLEGAPADVAQRITASAVQYAIESAADPAMFPDSHAAYGAWQVQKLYLHLYAETVLDFDWTLPHDALHGKSPMDFARAGFARHTSRAAQHDVEVAGEYENSLFGLAYSAVGEDVVKNDLFENLPGYAPVDAPARLFSPEPAPAPTAAPSSGAVLGSAAAYFALALGAGIALIAAICIAQAVGYAKRRTGRR